MGRCFCQKLLNYIYHYVHFTMCKSSLYLREKKFWRDKKDPMCVKVYSKCAFLLCTWNDRSSRCMCPCPPISKYRHNTFIMEYPIIKLHGRNQDPASPWFYGLQSLTSRAQPILCSLAFGLLNITHPKVRQTQ